MKNQNGAVSDNKSDINMAITVEVAGSSLFTTAAQQAPLAARRYITISRKKLLHSLDSEGGVRLNAWIDSMRASSPTHVKSSPLLPQDQSSWINQHPSALEMFEQITKASKGKQIVMFLDYDGTLSPIVDDPDRAFMSDAMRATVRKLARHFPTAIVSGRCRDKVYSFVRLAELYYAGSHGMDIKGPSKGSIYKNGTDHQAVLFQPASEFVPMIDEVYKALLEKTKFTPGAKVEHNKFCLSVHFRCVDEKKWSELALLVRAVLKEYPKLRLTQGRKVLEIRPTIKWDKGKALEFLLESLGFANSADIFPIYIGDDRTDEDAFKVLRERGQGFGILVSKIPKETSASYSLQEPSEVMNFLQQLVQRKRKSLRQKFKLRRQLQEMKELEHKLFMVSVACDYFPWCYQNILGKISPHSYLVSTRERERRQEKRKRKGKRGGNSGLLFTKLFKVSSRSIGRCQNRKFSVPWSIQR